MKNNQGEVIATCTVETGPEVSRPPSLLKKPVAPPAPVAPTAPSHSIAPPAVSVVLQVPPPPPGPPADPNWVRFEWTDIPTFYTQRVGQVQNLPEYSAKEKVVKGWGRILGPGRGPNRR